MRDQQEYDAIVVMTPDDFQRTRPQHRRIVEMLPVRHVLFIGRDEVGTLLAQEVEEGVYPGELRGRVGFIEENDVLSFDRVHALMNEIGSPFRPDGEVPRRMTGWYYQQFLKFAYADFCRDEFYMTWDGDTVPCKPFSMFSESGTPYLDYKREYHEEYFKTLKNLIGMTKVIEPSFISEHMLFKRDLVWKLRKKIEDNDALEGSSWWEKILHAVRPEKLLDNSFSEFETYGTFAALTVPGAYRIREWHSFRLAGEFFDVNTICERDYEWLGRDFAAISFEKGMSIRQDHRNLFDNPKYQEKLSARQMLETVQEVFQDGYIEKWDLPAAGTKEREGGPERLKYLKEDTWKEYEELGDRLLDRNVNQAWLCYENAAFLTADEAERKRLTEKKDALKDKGVSVQKTCIVILSYNQKYLMARCLESIETNCNPEAYSLVVFDNASKDGVADELKNYAANHDDTAGGAVTLVLNDENLGFAGGCNAACAYAPATDDLLLLNNDTRMPANALFWLRMGLYDRDDVGAVGGVQNYGSNPDQAEDVEFPLPDQFMEYGARRNTYMDYPYDERNKLSGFAMLIRGGLYGELNGFDEQFSPGYFEDDDLCFRIRERGYRLLVCHNSFIYHAGSQSFRERKDILELFERNRQRFIAKWGYPSWIEEHADMLDPSGIKLIVWDLDKTFWEGVLSEEAVKPVDRNLEIVRLAADKGIVNSICSKNEEEQVREELMSERFGNLWDLFVFPSVAWSSKGPRIRQMLTDMALRAENVLFIDDELINLREARAVLPGLQVAEPDILDALLRKLKSLPDSDPEHKRLERYRLLEKKTEKKKEAVSNEAFLRESDIRVTCRRDCTRFAERIHELLGRTNQLNFTKERPTRAEVDALLADERYECAIVRARDIYGDYGEVGFYAMEREEPHTLRHFAFSCRAMGMGVEQYIWQKLGFPPLTVVGETAVTLKKENIVDWIREEEPEGSSAVSGETDPSGSGEKAAEAADVRQGGETGQKDAITGKILLKGPCDMGGMIPYFSEGLELELEANFVDSRGIVVAGSNNSVHLYEAFHTPPEEIRRTIERAPFLCEADFITFMFQDPYTAVVFSTLSEGHSGVYRDRTNDLRICFGSCNFDLTDPANREKYRSGEYAGHNVAFTDALFVLFAEHFEFEGVLDPALAVRNLQWMREKLPPETKLILLLGSEIEAENNTPEFADHAQNYRRLNEKIREAFAGRNDVELINVTDFVTGQDAFEGCTNHYSRMIYRQLAQETEKRIRG
ncbi:MAG: HAD-IIIC family phosphatase [Lachnospiraceae bacterium]|nr:HAD-IIIC family phosphatase [Lachnospiraceae bacterium]